MNKLPIKSQTKGIIGGFYRVIPRMTLMSVLCLLFYSSMNVAVSQVKYPYRFDPYMNDNVKILTQSQKVKVREKLRSLHAESGTEVSVLTIESVEKYFGKDQSIEDFATSVFNHWGVGDADKNEGVLFIVSMADRKVRIELGAGYSTDMDIVAKTIIEENIIPYFKKGKPSKGVIKGVNAISRKIVVPEPSGFTDKTINFMEQAASDPQAFFHSFFVELMVGLGMLVSTVCGWFFLRYKRCEKCRARMCTLSDEDEDLYLEDGQRLEEAIGSMSYKVHFCNQCNWHKVISRKEWGMRYEVCVSCNYRTVRQRVSVLESPTYFSTGLNEVMQSCARCDYSQRWDVVIPKLEMEVDDYDDDESDSLTSSWIGYKGSSKTGSKRSRRSSGNSSGSGRSKGGGATGGW